MIIPTYEATQVNDLIQSQRDAGSSVNHNNSFHLSIFQAIMRETLGYTFKKDPLGVWNCRQTKFPKNHIFQIELDESSGV